MKPIYGLGHFFSNALHDLFFTGEAGGTEFIPREGPFILAANHVSFLDPMIFGAKVPREIHYLARKTLFKKGFGGWLLREVNALPVDLDSDSDVSAIKQVLRLLRAGEGVLLFPEGTRTRDGNLQDGRGGVGLIACKARVPVVPARIFGAFEAFGRHLPKPLLFRSVSVGFGPPLQPEDFDGGGLGRERYQHASGAIMRAIEAIRPPEEPGC